MVKDMYRVLTERAKKTLLSCIFAEVYIRNVLKKKRPHRLIIVKIDVVGDFILFSPFIKAYADVYKDHQISLVANVVCLPLARKICASIPQVDTIIPFDRQKFDRDYLYKIRLFRTLLKERGSIAIQPALSRSYVADILTRMTNAPERIGYKRGSGTISQEQKFIDDTFYTRLINRNNEITYEIDANIHFLTSLGGEIKDSLPHLEITVDEEKDAQKILKKYGLPQNTNYVLIQPGAGSPFRQWPIPRFAKILKYFIEEKGLKCIITGSAKEKGLAQMLRAEMSTHNASVIDLTGETDLIQLAAIAKGAVLYFGNETGTLHVSAAVGTPTLCIMGGGHFGRFFPYGDPDKNRMVYDRKMKCRNDNWRCAQTVKLGDPAPCIDAITVEDVLHALRAVHI